MVHGQVHPVMVKETVYAVLDGNELLGIWETQDIALHQAHFYEQANLILKGRLTICDIMPIRRNKYVQRTV